MLAFYGFATILVFLVLIMTKRLSVITALVLVPVVLAVTTARARRKPQPVAAPENLSVASSELASAPV